MTNPVSPGKTLPLVKSQPVYIQLSADSAARRHIFVAEPVGLEAIRRVTGGLLQSGGSAEIFWLGEMPNSLASRFKVEAFDNIASLKQAVKIRLSSIGMGVRLYLAGSEAMIWQVNQACLEMGLREDEIQREACGSLARRVFCVHCRHVIEGVKTNTTKCPSCEVLLEVRDHFSRTLAAYIGVVVNAEDPSDIPELQEQFV